jgi:hypothetical protein
MLTSTVGLAHAEDGAELLPMRETVIDDDCALCSLRVTMAENASGSSHTESPWSALGAWNELKNLKDDVLLEAEDRPSDDIMYC